MGGADEKGRLIVARLDSGNGWGHNTPCRDRCKNWVDGACLCQSCQYCHFTPSLRKEPAERGVTLSPGVVFVGVSGAVSEMFSVLTHYFGETCTHFSRYGKNNKEILPAKCWNNMRCQLYELEYKSSGQKYKVSNWIE